MYNHTWYDGTAYVTMCPIAKGKSFTYSFLVSFLFCGNPQCR